MDKIESFKYSTISSWNLLLKTIKDEKNINRIVYMLKMTTS